MKKCWIIISLMSFIGLAGCSSVPNPKPRPWTDQATLEASQHWGVLAQDFAKQVITAMEADPLWIVAGGESGNLIDGKDFGYMYEEDSVAENIVPPIYLQTNDLSSFGKTFRNYLITEITKLGYPIAHHPEGAVIARWSVNKVKHNADRKASGWPGVATGASAIGYGVYKIIDNTSSAFPAVMATAIAIDLYDAVQETVVPSGVSHTEIVLTFTVSKETKILSRQTQAYYVNAEDYHHYNSIADYAGQESHLKPVAFKATN